MKGPASGIRTTISTSEEGGHVATRPLLVASVTLASVAAAAAHARQPAPEFYTFTFINTDPTAIQVIYAIPSNRRVYVVPDDQRVWGPNLLARADTITPGEAFTMRLPKEACLYHIRVIYTSGRVEEIGNANICPY